jgi:hypothetical protein
MSDTIDPEKLKELAKEFAKNIKTQDDLAAMSRQLLKLTVETYPLCELHLDEEVSGI